MVKEMNDKEWLDRVWLASRVYQQRVDQDQQRVEHFVQWLYREYGIVMPERKQNGKS